MKIFVPSYRQIIPAKHSWMFTKWMVEVSESDLRNYVIPHWKKIDTSKDIHEVNRLFKMSLEDVCGCKLERGTLDPFIRRDALTIHAGASSGNESFAPAFLKTAFTTGFLTAKYGWNLTYGGGNTGGMGEAARGFYAGINAFGRHEDQYSVQVIPADFVLSVQSLNGLRPNNEGLCSTTDAALVMPDFMTRRYILDHRCVAAITCPGSLGSLDEWSDIAVAIKTGLSTVKLYTLNPYIEQLGCRFYDPLKQQIENSIKCGLQKPDIYDYLKFMETPEDAHKHLMTEQGKTRATPEQKYRARKQRFGFTPGVARAVPV